ncbi:hypothetical protein [Nitratifractor sp.]|uniref:hypothetical protein n=1 Tax=Nitratifractor sp. TaxID=2268144 RepID=UPI0025EF8108|nr:hypothetical protein [Nitratifractor sp.]
MQKNNIVLARVFFVVAFFALLSLHHLSYLFAALITLWIVSFPKIAPLTIRVLRSILIFNLGLSLGYAAMALWRHETPWEYLFYINLKVYVLTYFVFWFFGRHSIVRLMGFSKDLSYLTTIALSQIVSYKKSFEDFRLAYLSRGLRLKDKNPRFIARTFEYFLEKSLYDADERTLAMKARGFFRD